LLKNCYSFFRHWALGTGQKRKEKGGKKKEERKKRREKRGEKKEERKKRREKRGKRKERSYEL